MQEGLSDENRLRWERRCLERAKAGDRQAFAELYREYARPLYSKVLMPRLGNPQAAEDALSETFRMLLERVDRWEHQGVSIWFWLSRVAMNKANDMHRVKGRTSRALASFESLLAPLRPETIDPGEAAQSDDERARLAGSVRDVLERINPRYRRAIELRFLEDRSRQDCADALDVKLGTFDVVLLRALRAFRKEWEDVIGAVEAEEAAV